MSDIDISQVINQMRVMASQAQAQPVKQTQETQGADFSSILKQSVESVNSTQKNAGKLTEAFQAGDPNTNIAEVMVALQKASVSFEAMKQVRSKLVDAYKEIMRMQV
jgi:flagellar hook-basal body complex protein FliE